MCSANRTSNEPSQPTYFKEIATSLLPIVLMFGVFQLVSLKLDRRTLGRIGVGLAYTYIGLVFFLTGANVGFMPAGNYLGQVLAGQTFRWLLVPIGMLIGYFIVKAEPAVYVLWFLIPGYAFAIGIAFVVPKLYTAIAFDAGGVASGPMTATFLLPLAQGACAAVGGNIVTDAFGMVAMVAMIPPHHRAAHGPDGAAQAAPRPQRPRSTARTCGSASCWMTPPAPRCWQSICRS